MMVFLCGSSSIAVAMLAVCAMDGLYLVFLKCQLQYVVCVCVYDLDVHTE